MQIAAPVPLRRLPLGQHRAWPVLAALLGVLVVAGGGLFAYQRFFAPAPPAPLGQMVPVERGTVSASVSATGSVVATRQAKLVFANSGRIKEVLVNVGDHVTAGQPLGSLLADTYQVKLDTARSQLAAAQVKLAQLTEGATAEDVVAARRRTTRPRPNSATCRRGRLRPTWPPLSPPWRRPSPHTRTRRPSSGRSRPARPTPTDPAPRPPSRVGRTPWTRPRPSSTSSRPARPPRT